MEGCLSPPSTPPLCRVHNSITRSITGHRARPVELPCRNAGVSCLPQCKGGRQRAGRALLPVQEFPRAGGASSHLQMCWRIGSALAGAGQQLELPEAFSSPAAASRSILAAI